MECASERFLYHFDRLPAFPPRRTDSSSDGLDLNLPEGVTYTAAATPEPGTLALLLGGGMTGLLALRRRKK